MKICIALVVYFGCVDVALAEGCGKFTGLLPAWGYSGVIEPGLWYTLHPRYLTCSSDMQSPIDLSEKGSQKVSSRFLHITGTNSVGETVMKTPLTPPTLKVTEAGIHFDVAGLGLVGVGSSFPKNMLLNRILYKNPSDHTIDGKQFEVERQMWFTEISGNDDIPTRGACGEEIVILSELYDVGPEPDSYIDSMREYLSSFRDKGVEVEIPPRIPEKPLSGAVFTYKGSLTFPPCSQVATWIVSSSIKSLTYTQLGLLQSKNITAGDAGTNRPIQPRSGRQVYYHQIYRPTREHQFSELSACNYRDPAATCEQPRCVNNIGRQSGFSPPNSCRVKQETIPTVSYLRTVTTEKRKSAIVGTDENLLQAVLVLATILAILLIAMLSLVASRIGFPIFNSLSVAMVKTDHRLSVFEAALSDEEIEEEEQEECEEESEENIDIEKGTIPDNEGLLPEKVADPWDPYANEDGTLMGEPSACWQSFCMMYRRLAGALSLAFRCVRFGSENEDGDEKQVSHAVEFWKVSHPSSLDKELVGMDKKYSDCGLDIRDFQDVDEDDSSPTGHYLRKELLVYHIALLSDSKSNKVDNKSEGGKSNMQLRYELGEDIFLEFANTKAGG